MDAAGRYEFDRQGYLVIPAMLSTAEVRSLTEAIDWLTEHALGRLGDSARPLSLFGGEYGYHHEPELGYHATLGPRGNGSGRDGQSLMIEDFFNADAAFDVLVNHPPTMDVIRDIVQGPIRINNSELRIRYANNSTVQHMGGPIGQKYRYSFNENGIDAMMVRMVYFLNDVRSHQGAFSVVPATHKANYASPYTGFTVDDEPGMIGLEVKAGDAVIFTENLRHGGLTNASDQPRKTLHIGYGPFWMMSQNVCTADEPQYILPQTLERYDDEQRALFLTEPPVWRDNGR